MRYAAALLPALALAAVALFWWRDHAPAPAGEPPLDLPPGGSKLTLVQRHDANVPGSNQRLRVHIGDITRAQVELTLVRRDGRQLTLATSVSEGDSLGFTLGGQRYHLGVERLENLLMATTSRCSSSSRATPSAGGSSICSPR